MIIEKKMMESCSVFYIEQKIEFEKFNCFFVNFLKFWENKRYVDRGWKSIRQT